MLLALGFAAIYSLANYWLVIATGAIPLDRNVANAWLPLLLGLVVTNVFIAPRLRVLAPDKDGDPPFIYWIIAAALVIAPTCLAQYYLTAETGKLVQVDRSEMIASAPRGSYYKVTSICVDRAHGIGTERAELSGRYNQYLDFKLYALAPTCAEGPTPRAWVAFTYRGSVDSRASTPVKRAKEQALVQRANKEFDAYDFGKVQYFEALGRTSDRRIYEKLLSERHVAQTTPPIILVPHTEAFASRSGDTLAWAIRAFGIGSGALLLMILFRRLDPEGVAETKLPRSERRRRDHGIGQYLIPHREAYGLAILLDLNLGAYLAMVLLGLGVVSFELDDLVAWGAIYHPATHGLGVYRLVTSQFLHGGLMHIMSNMYGLFFAGALLSTVLRKWGLILCYLACGTAAAIASDVAHPATVTVGASGAIMGLFGILVALAVFGDRRVVGARVLILTNCAIFVGLTLFVGAMTLGVDNTAHVVGFLTGVLFGLAIFAFSWGAPFEPELEDGGGEASAAVSPAQ